VRKKEKKKGEGREEKERKKWVGLEDLLSMLTLWFFPLFFFTYDNLV